MKTLIVGAIRCSLMFLVTASLFSVRPAQAGYIVTLQEVGSNVVATGSGAIDLTRLTFEGQASTSPSILPEFGIIATGGFGSGFITFVNSGTGDLVAIFGLAFQLLVPDNYVSGSALSDSATYNNATFSSLGVTPGTYVWSWGGGANQNFTLQIVGTAPVPDQGSTLLLLMLGLLGLVTCQRHLVRKHS
jgi:protein with PEP-CTERM/exosortase system signal